jgi:hypothetical protein
VGPRAVLDVVVKRKIPSPRRESNPRTVLFKRFENRVLRIFRCKREEVSGGRRTLHYEELHNLYASQNIIGVIKPRRIWAGHVARMVEMRNAYSILVRKPEGKRPAGRPRHRWEDIRMNLREVGWEDVDWIHLAQDRDKWQDFVNVVMYLRVQEKVGNFLTS